MIEFIALLLAAVGTYLWRALGVGFSGRISTDSEFFRWISCVSYAMVAALTLRILLLPVSLLAELPLWARVAGCLVALGLMVWPQRGGLGLKWGGLVPALLAGCLVVAAVACLK